MNNSVTCNLHVKNAACDNIPHVCKSIALCMFVACAPVLMGREWLCP